MKILQVIPYLTPRRGGDVNVAYNISTQLIKRGHDVTIATTDFELDEEYVRSIENKGITVMPFHSIANLGFFLFSPNIKKWAKENIKNYDIVHLHDFRSYQNNIIHKYSKRFHVPFVLQAHGSLPRIMEKRRLKGLYDLIWGNKILHGASKLIALNNKEAEQYKENGVDDNKIKIIPNGIDLSKYRSLPKRGEFRKKFDIADNEKLILYLGRIHKIKGIDLLVMVFADLIKEVDNAKLVIVGPDSGFLSMLQKQINDLKINNKILFTGPLYERDKLRAYVDSDIFVLPSVYESFPVTALEACACGTSVIVTDRCGIADIIDNKVGYVVKYDEDQLMDAIFKVLSDEKLRGGFGEAGRKLIKERFDWGKIVKRVEKVYSALKTE